MNTSEKQSSYKVSELIGKLKKILQEHGDLPLATRTPYNDTVSTAEGAVYGIRQVRMCNDTYSIPHLVFGRGINR